ncbi:ABC-type glutathione transport system ATPase component [Lysinibacillus sp. RC46]
MIRTVLFLERDRIVFMNDGYIVEEGTREELFGHLQH